jgi:hypothetical protein
VSRIHRANSRRVRETEVIGLSVTILEQDLGCSVRIPADGATGLGRCIGHNQGFLIQKTNPTKARANLTDVVEKQGGC